MKTHLALALILMLGGTQISHAQVSENTKLFKDVMELDNHFFDVGFNQCKLDQFEKYTSERLEFFHDKGGTQNRPEFLQAVKKNICSNPDGKPIRTLVPGSSKVFPLENNGVLYGAIQQGEHQFHTKGTDIALTGYTVAKFTHVWIIQNGQWKLKTALSYDHQHKTVKATAGIPIKKAVPKPFNLFHISIASLSLSLYLQD